MAEMGLVVIGAAGRMGCALIRAIDAIPGARLVAGIERPGAPELGRDSGELAGLGGEWHRHHRRCRSGHGLG